MANNAYLVDILISDDMAGLTFKQALLSWSQHSYSKTAHTNKPTPMNQQLYQHMHSDQILQIKLALHPAQEISNTS